MYMKKLILFIPSIVGAWLFVLLRWIFWGETETTDLDQATVFRDSLYGRFSKPDLWILVLISNIIGIKTVV